MKAKKFYQIYVVESLVFNRKDHRMNQNDIIYEFEEEIVVKDE